MVRTGTKLVEVETKNRTHLRDLPGCAVGPDGPDPQGPPGRTTGSMAPRPSPATVPGGA
ncbi:hypothetical protein [Paracoccus beibuensis]|uniref:hypothetical protein n=1 Tax=Paracoccus beibuensis TaxID=547602 RepID=UPI00223F11B0|nr:hypothetical protein [Paracoccus beibuensis]